MIAARFSGIRLTFAATILIVLLATAYVVHVSGNAGLSLSILLGAAFGIVLQRSRFCFFCNFRDWIDTGDPRGLWAILVALAVGVVGYAVVFGAWLPDPSTGRLPPDAFIGPVSWALALAGVAFGVGMAISGSCISAHIYRLGEGSATAPFALLGTFAGFMLGFASWNPIYLAMISQGWTIWLPQQLGYAGTLLVTFASLAAIAWLLSLRKGLWQEPPPPRSDTVTRFLIDRWPASVGGAIVGVLAMVAYLRVAPLGVTAEISNRANQASAQLGLLPARLEGLDTLRGCVNVVKDLAFSNNGGFVGAVVLASFAAALAANQFRPRWPTYGQVARGLFGGVLLGWGATIGLGCTVGTLLSGIMAGALSGWIFGFAVFSGVAFTLWIERTRRPLPR